VDKITERPVYPKSIIRTRVLDNPFTDITPRETTSQTTESPIKEEPEKKKRPKTVKNHKLLSFGDDDDDDDDVFAQRGGSAMKSSHDLLRSDPALSNKPAVLKVVEPNVSPPTPSSAKGTSKPEAQEDLTIRPISPIPNSDIRDERETKELGELVTKGGRDMAASKNTQSALSEMLGQYKKPSANKDTKGLKRGSREDELLARLGNFQSKIRKTKLQPSDSAGGDQTTKDDLCKIHRQSNCESCYKGNHTRLPENDDWLVHSLQFNKARSSTAKYAPKFDDYVTIDPRTVKDDP
ncbi:Peptidyl-prolyl isomerase cwc27, partial [Coemansia furcata]